MGGRDPADAGLQGSGRSGTGLVKRYIAKMSDLSRPHVTRLIARYCETGDVKVQRAPVILFDVVQVFAGAHLDPFRKFSGILQISDGAL